MRMQEARLGLGLLAALGIVSVLAAHGSAARAVSPSTSSAASAALAPHDGAHAGMAAYAATPQGMPACSRWTGPGDGPVLVRRNISQLNAFDLTALRKGVQVMQSRPESDPTSWIYQASIHGTESGELKTAWQTCQHGSYLFLAWHRMYLYFFERILRKASGLETLTQPYWNYSNPAQRPLPLPYRDRRVGGNTLLIEQRQDGINDGVPLPESATTYDAAFRYVNFTAPPDSSAGFGGMLVTAPQNFGYVPGALENVPHNAVHNIVGGPMGYMSNQLMAARDPIFWAHHSNVDRLWTRWLALGGGRANPPTTDSFWYNAEFTFFDENGTCVLVSAKQVIDTVKQLNYQYDDASTPVPTETTLLKPLTTGPGGTRAVAAAAADGQAPASTVLAESAAGTRVALTGDRQNVAVEIKEDQKPAIKALAAAAPTTELRLKLDQIDYDQGAFYEVYLNLPDSERAPSPKSPYFVGVLSPFAGKPHAHGGEGHAPAAPNVKVDFDLTPVIAALTAKKLWKGDAMHLTFVPGSLVRGPKASAAPAKTSKLSIGRVQVVSSK